MRVRVSKTADQRKKNLPIVSLDSLNSQQLSAVKKQLDEEVEHLTGSFGQLHAAQGKFRECARVVKSRVGLAKDGMSA